MKSLWTSRILGGVLLVSGTSIGAAMLALPVSTGMAGFLPATLLMFLIWSLMTYTAFLVLEVTLWMPKDANMVTMAEYTLGKPGKIFAWGCYLFLLYALTTAYLAVGGPLVLDAVASVTTLTLPRILAPLPWLLLFALSVYQGHHYVDRMNRVLMLGMCITYAVLLALVIPYGEGQNLRHVHWPALWVGIPIVATSFGFHIIIPSLASYLGHNRRALVRVIAIGSLIPLLIYISWEALTLSVLPLEGPLGVIQGYQSGSNGASLLAQVLESPWVDFTAHAFLFFAIVTSFLGVSMSLWDFLRDGLNLSLDTSASRLWLAAITFGPPLVATTLNPHLFLSALDYAGTFGVITLLGLLPALMVYSGRYRKHLLSDAFETPGGRSGLFLAAGISLFLLCHEVLRQLGMLE